MLDKNNNFRCFSNKKRVFVSPIFFSRFKTVLRIHMRAGWIGRERQTGRYLVITQSASGYIGFPKGHFLPGETKEQCASREGKEEVGIYIPPDFLAEHGHLLQHRNHFMFVISFDYGFPPVQIDGKEITHYAWKTLDELVELSRQRKVSKMTSRWIQLLQRMEPPPPPPLCKYQQVVELSHRWDNMYSR
jgi:8-oxo-dGTP pyrophosphatase MutT (NUDIX family)